MTNYTRSFHNKTISITNKSQLESVEAANLMRYIGQLETAVDDYTKSIKQKLAGVADDCRPINLSVNGEAFDGVIEALRKELDVLRADYEEMIEQIKREAKRYEQLKQESYVAYQQYLSEQLKNRETGILNTDNRTHIPG
ncbi:MAG: hypothetical protein UE699_04450 [Bacilli bacterium]|nr:hypothetical protein [Bacilli bacterium]